MRALRRWEPTSELEQMRRQVERMFENVLGRGFAGMPQLGTTQAFMPNVEVYATGKDVVLNAELPGIDPKDVTVEITEDSVILFGETSSSSEIKEDTYFQSERQYGRFERVIPLPERIKDQEAKATFKNGLLTVRAPLMEPIKRQQPHKVTIATE